MGVLRRHGLMYSSGGIPATNLEIHFNSQNVVESSALISEITDLSDNSKNATQTTDSLKPSLIANQLNGYPCIRSNGSSTIMSFSNVLLNSDYTTYEVIKYSTTTPFSWCFGSSDYSVTMYLGTLSTFVIQNSTSEYVSITQGTLSTSNYYIFTTCRIGNDYYIYKNNTLLGTVNSAISKTLNINKLFFMGGYNIYSKSIDFVELLAYSSGHTEEVRIDIYDFLKSKYNL